MSFFESVTKLPEDPILKLPILFRQLKHPNKVNLGVGAYRDDHCQPFLLPSVLAAEKKILISEKNKEYLPIEGHPDFLNASLQLLFGSDFSERYKAHFSIFQAVGGSGALRIGGEFLAQETSRTIYISTPTWPNHKGIFSRCGLQVKTYPYYDAENHQLDYSALINSVKQMTPKSILLLHVNCHNPTGLDPTFAQWQEISTLIKEQNLIPFFDFAYQGFVDTPDLDAEPIRYFAAQGHEMLVANSYSKNFGLYGERVGALTVVTHQEEVKNKINSQIKQIIRNNYSSPPLHGGSIVSTLLNDPELKKEWEKDLATMRNRINTMRVAFVQKLESKNTGRNWDYLKKQHGFFSFSGLTEEQVERLMIEDGILMPTNGRINVAGLTSTNLDYVVNAVCKVLH